MSPISTPGVHKLYKLTYPLHGDALTQVLAFLAKWLLIHWLLPQPSTGDQDLNNFRSTLPDDEFYKRFSFSSYSVFKKIVVFFKNANYFSCNLNILWLGGPDGSSLLRFFLWKIVVVSGDNRLAIVFVTSK